MYYWKLWKVIKLTSIEESYIVYTVNSPFMCTLSNKKKTSLVGQMFLSQRSCFLWGSNQISLLWKIIMVRPTPW